MVLLRPCSVLPASMQRQYSCGALTVPAPKVGPKALCRTTPSKTLARYTTSTSAASSPVCAESWPQAAVEASPALLLHNGVNNEQPKLRSANHPVMGLLELEKAHTKDTAAVISAGPLLRSLVDWVLAVEKRQLLQGSATAVQNVDEGSNNCASLQTLPGSGLWRAETAMKNAAQGLAYHVLQALNHGNCAEGLSWERLPQQLQCAVFHVLQRLGCVNGWGLPLCRPLPALAAAIGTKLVPGQRASLNLQQYITLKTLKTNVVHDELHDTWDGHVEVYVHPQQLINCWELAKALDGDMLAHVMSSSSSNGLSLQLFNTAGRLGIGKAAAALSAGTERVKCVHELLLVKMHRGFLAVSNQVLLQLQHSLQPSWQSFSVPLSAASNGFNVLVGSQFGCESLESSSSSDVITNSACGCGGCGGGRGSLTAVGADDLHRSAADGVVVPGLRQNEHDNVQLHLVPLVCQTSVAGAASVGDVGSSSSKSIGWLRRGLSVFRRWRK